MNKKHWIDNIYRIRGTVPGRHDALRLDKNERITKFNSYIYEEILSKLRHEHLTAYPETEPLYDLLAKYHNVNRDQVVVTAGSDAGIKYCFELLADQGCEVITLSPTFAMVDIYAQLYGVKQVRIGYDADLKLKFEDLLAAISHKTALIIIANPNSPTGTLISDIDIRLVISKARENGAVVLVDEAYYGFSRQTVLPYIAEYDNLIVARTFSKSFGLAGCRVGYLIAQSGLAHQLYKFRPMYEVNAFGVLAATTILEHSELVKEYIDETEIGRAYLKESLDRLKLAYIDTNTNFIHVDFGIDRKKIEEILLAHKILVRGGPGVTGYEDYLRISIGPAESMTPLVSILETIYGR